MDATKKQGKKKVSVIAVEDQELRAHVSEVGIFYGLLGLLSGFVRY